MLSDWIWAVGITLLVWLEVGGWARWLSRAVDGTTIGSRLSYAAAFAVTAQTYFVFSLLGWGSPRLHVALLLGGIVSLALPRLLTGERRPSEPRLHLKLARYFSPLTWARSWPWLLGPILWLGLRVLDALVPHNAPETLAYHLYAPREWLAQGAQRLEPLHPLDGLASVWEALYYHVLAVYRAFGGGTVPRTALVRAQLTAQLLHLTAGVGLTMTLVARLLAPYLRAGWNRLVHLETSPQRRHRLGMASTVFIPSSLFFGWLSCGGISSSMVPAGAEWGATMLVAASLVAVIELQAGLAGFFWGTAVAVSSPAALAGWGLVAAAALAWRRSSLGSGALQAIAGAALGLAPWLYRNFTQAGVWIYPPREPGAARPGWFADYLPHLAWRPEWNVLVIALVVVGIGALGYRLWLARARIPDRALRALLVFTLVSAGVAVFEGLIPSSAAALIACAALGFEYLLVFGPKPPGLNEAARWVPHFWLVLGLFAVPLPFHLLWQNLPYALEPAVTYLHEFHPHYDAKLWANIHLPPTTRIAWTADDEFYYLEPPAACIRDSTVIHDALLRATTPVERVQVLCRLGFDVLAWEDRDHGPEAAGLSSWLRLNRSAVLAQVEDVTFLALGCQKP